MYKVVEYCCLELFIFSCYEYQFIPFQYTLVLIKTYIFGQYASLDIFSDINAVEVSMLINIFMSLYYIVTEYGIMLLTEWIVLYDYYYINPQPIKFIYLGLHGLI